MAQHSIPDSDHFVYEGGELCVDGQRLASIAEMVQTPCYVYSAAAVERAYASVAASIAAVPSMVAYAMKANSNGEILRRLSRAGAAVDIVSGGELQRALRAGFPARHIAFSGVGKTDEEIAAALSLGIYALHVESPEELWVIEKIARDKGLRAEVALRVNPDVDAKTHPYISTGIHSTKFGIEFKVARALLPRLLQSPHLSLTGITCHVGSLVLEPSPIAEATQRIAEFAVECHRAGAPLTTLDAGGGWPILYGNEEQQAATHAEFGAALIAGARRGGVLDLGLKLMIEPGRSIVGDAGVLLTRVLYVKEQAGKRFVVVDGSMTELIRPSLYGAYHAVMPVQRGAEQGCSPADLVGPVCESSDFLAKDRPLPMLKRGDLLAVRGAGAYAAVMGSNYNSRPLAAEVLVDPRGPRVVRDRQPMEDLWRHECELSDG